MTLQDYEQKFMFEMEDLWNSGANCQFLSWDAFVYSMWQSYKKESEEELA